MVLVDVVALVAVLAVPLAGLAWAAARVRRRGGGESLMNPFDEVWHPAAHDERAAPEPGSATPPLTPAGAPAPAARRRRGVRGS